MLERKTWWKHASVSANWAMIIDTLEQWFPQWRAHSFYRGCGEAKWMSYESAVVAKHGQFVTGLPGKCKADDESTPNVTTTGTKIRGPCRKKSLGITALQFKPEHYTSRLLPLSSKQTCYGCNKCRALFKYLKYLLTYVWGEKKNAGMRTLTILSQNALPVATGMHTVCRQILDPVT